VLKPDQPLIGLFGGTFDPIHLGHLNALDALCREIEFEQVHWVLSARPPHKDQVSAPIDHRFSMLQIALAGNQKYVADDTEITRQSIGSDSLLNLPSWYRYDELVERVNWVVMHRPGYQLDLPEQLTQRFVDSAAELKSADGGAIWLFDQSNFDISSTQLRQALSLEQTASGLKKTALSTQKNVLESQDRSELIKQFLASDVINYIRAHQLYKIEPMKPEQIKDQVVDALENVKGQDIKVIDIADISDFADFMVVASGTSDTHVKALAREASDTLRSQGVKPLNEDGADVGEWVLVDFGDVVLHVMRPEVREYYDLEKLWDEDVRRLVEQHRENGDDQ